MKSFRNIFSENPLLPVVDLKDPDHALPLQFALKAGGINILEITLRTDAALEGASKIAHHDDFIVGLGSLLEADQFRYAAQIGVDFTTSPGLNEDLLEVANEEKIAYLPGVFTPSEIMLARDREYDTLKFFPAFTNVGVLHYPQVSRSFPSMSFCLTGGIGADNYLETFRLPGVIAVGGSWLVPQDLIDQGDWKGITDIATQASAAARKVRDGQVAEQPANSLGNN